MINKYFLYQPHSIHYQNLSDLHSHQKFYLARLLKSIKIDSDDFEALMESSALAPARLCLKPWVSMRTSGTTTGNVRRYRYSRRELFLIQDYHYKRILHFSNVTNNNKAAFVSQITRKEPNSGLFGPIRLLELGIKTKVHTLRYNLKHSKQWWHEHFSRLSTIKPDILYCRPSELELFCDAIDPQPYAIMLTGENLSSWHREKASNLFTKVINKMRCWDGGLSFFECSYGRKHINDELSIVYTNDSKELVSTDLFNYSQPFLKYKNGDTGLIEAGKCLCGIFGNYFEQFYGRVIESLTTANGSYYPGPMLVDTLQYLIIKLNQPDTIFNIIQNQDYSIEVYLSRTDSDLLNKSIIELIDRVVNDRIASKIPISIKDKKVITNFSKQLTVRSYVNKIL